MVELMDEDTERWHPGEPPPPLSEREPPWSEEAEQSVLGAILLDNSALPLVGDILVPRSFFSRRHQLIYTTLQEQIAARLPADPVTVDEALARHHDAEEYGGLAYLTALAQVVPSARNCRRYAELVVERASERAAIAAAEEIARLAWDGKRDLTSRLEQMAAAVSRVQQVRKNPGARIPLLTLHELKATAAALTWVVKHVIPADSIGMLFGASGTFKSFIALDLALHIAHGLPWMGRKTKQGAVIYIAAEGGPGVWGRIHAWHKRRGLAWEGISTQMRVVPVAVDVLADAWRVVDAAQAVGVQPALVVVDTLSQTFSGEENSSADIAAYLRELGARFKSLWSCAVAVIHHTGHNATERPRGSSAMKANIDWMFGLRRDEKERLATMSCDKQKDGDPFPDAMFGITVEALGVDEDNDPITSLAARHLGTEEDVAEARAIEAAEGRGGRTARFMGLVQNGMQEKHLRKAFYEDVVADLDAEAKKKAYQRARQDAERGGFIEFSEGFVIKLKGWR